MRGTVDPRRHAVRGNACARGRRPPVDHHTLGRPGAARMRGVGACLRPGPGVDPASRSIPARSRWRYLGILQTLDPPRRSRTCPGPRRRQAQGRPTKDGGGWGLSAAHRGSKARCHAGRGRRHHARSVRAADDLERSNVAVDVLCLTSPDLIFRALQARQGLAVADDAILDALFPPDRTSPIVTVLDGHPHTLAFLGAIHAVRVASLGVNDFGQSGDIQDLYRHFGIDTDTIVGAAFDVIEA